MRLCAQTDFAMKSTGADDTELLKELLLRIAVRCGMIRIREAIIVEGRYDKNTLAQIVDAPILETSGFGIFHDSQRLALLPVRSFLK